MESGMAPGIIPLAKKGENMFESYLDEMRFIAWVAALAAGASVIMLLMVLVQISELKARINQSKPDPEALADAVARKLSRFAKRPANVPPPPE